VKVMWHKYNLQIDIQSIEPAMVVRQQTSVTFSVD
jgi:hypothetical protein